MLFSRLRRLQNTNQNCSPVAVREVGVCTTGRGVAAGARMCAEPPLPKSRLFYVLAEPRRDGSAQQVRFRVMLANLADPIGPPDRPTRDDKIYNTHPLQHSPNADVGRVDDGGWGESKGGQSADGRLWKAAEAVLFLSQSFLWGRCVKPVGGLCAAFARETRRRLSKGVLYRRTSAFASGCAC